MTEEERFKKVYNVYMNYEQELAQRGMENVATLAIGLTQAYVLFLISEACPNCNLAAALAPVNDETWDEQP